MNSSAPQFRARRTTWLAERLRELEPTELEALERALEPLWAVLPEDAR